VAKYSSADFGFLTIGGFDLTDVSTKFEDSISRPMIDSTPYGVTSAELLPGLFKTYELNGIEAWYDDDADSINAALVDLAVGSNMLLVAPFGNIAPATGVGCNVIAANDVYKTAYKRSGEVGNYHKASFEVAVSGIVDQNARLVAPLQLYSGASSTTAATYLDWGADGAAGGRVYAVVTDIHWGAATALAISLQDCNTSGGAYSDHTVMTSIVPATTPEHSRTAEMKVLANATVQQYTCMALTWTGVATAAAVRCAMVVAYD
jgi:hypothetical protein